MNRPHRSRTAFRLIAAFVLCVMMLAGSLRGSVASVRQSQLARGDLGLASPSLIVTPEGTDPGAITVTGQGFSPEGKVYLAIYDQMAKQLYEHRWVKASSRITTYDAGIRREFDDKIAIISPGGELRETFSNLCGAAALIRGFDYGTERWSNWQVVQPPCSGTASSMIANNLLVPQTLPMSVVNPAAPTTANNLNRPAAPALLKASETTDAGAIVVTGSGFTAGGRVYVAIYDQMGAELHETRWVQATPVIEITGARAGVPEAHPIIAPTGGTLMETFSGLCNARVMVRAYDQTTAIWTNWMDIAPICQTAHTYGPH